MGSLRHRAGGPRLLFRATRFQRVGVRSKGAMLGRVSVMVIICLHNCVKRACRITRPIIFAWGTSLRTSDVPGGCPGLACLCSQTALMYAAEHGKVKACNVLIDGGANINMGHRYKKVHPARQLASHILQGFRSRPFVTLPSTKRGLPTHTRPANLSQTALMYGSEKGWLDVVKLLVAEGADVNGANEYGEVSRAMCLGANPARPQART